MYQCSRATAKGKSEANLSKVGLGSRQGTGKTERCSGWIDRQTQAGQIETRLRSKQRTASRVRVQKNDWKFKLVRIDSGLDWISFEFRECMTEPKQAGD